MAGTDSVDADAGGIDGLGNDGRSWYSADSTSMWFTFDAGALGALPTHVGSVWTDAGWLLGSASGNLGDGLFQGQTAEDRFFGVYYSGGVKKLEFAMLNSDDWEADHLQYGSLTGYAPASVPVPAGVWLMLSGLGLAGWFGRRR